jgi:hypothetical protein
MQKPVILTSSNHRYEVGKYYIGQVKCRTPPIKKENPEPSATQKTLERGDHITSLVALLLDDHTVDIATVGPFPQHIHPHLHPGPSQLVPSRYRSAVIDPISKSL